MTATHTDSRAFEDWVEQARRVPVETELDRRGIRLKGRTERSGPCPRCGGDDRFSVNTRDQIFNCRGSANDKGKSGGDVIDMVQHLDGCEFVVAVETLTGSAPPGRASAETPEEKRAREARLAAAAEDRRRREAEQARRDEEQRRRTLDTVEGIWGEARPFAGSRAQAYLAARGLTPPPRLVQDLRFVPELGYRGYANADSDAEVPLGSFPAMIAPIRDVTGRMIGLHRTYLDPNHPGRLVPPGDRRRNKGKKVLREAKGGMVWLGGEPGPVLAIGEGIETVLSWYALGLVDEEDLTLATSIALGNLAGSAMGSIAHPTKRGADGRPVQIPNGVPNLDAPGIVLPDQVERVYLLGDGDSDGPSTRARLLVAARRFRAQGRAVLISMAPDGSDFNDVLRRELGAEEAA